MRHPAVHAPYHPIQLGSMPARPAACHATVLTVTAITALTNWTVAASASILSRPPAIRWPVPRLRWGAGSATTSAVAPDGTAAGGSMK
jgi:hypothetical protein